MFAIAVLLVLLLVLAGVLVVAAVRPQPEAALEPGSRLSNVRRRTSRWRWGGVALGVVFSVSALQVGGTVGRGVMLAAPLFALGVLVGVIVGELRVAAPSVAARSAPLEVRRVRDYAPKRLTGAVALAAGTLALLLVATTAAGSPDDVGRAGRWLVRACSESLTESRGPWPGSFYSLPLAAVVLSGLAATAFALQQVVRRPRQGEDVRVDDMLRCNAGSAVVAASGILVAVPLVGASVFAGIALFGSGSACPLWWGATVGWILVGCAACAAVLAVRCIVVLALPTRTGAGHEVG